MPLQHSASQSAFESNLQEEMKTHPQKQALAIAYSIRRRAGGEPEVAKAAVAVHQIGTRDAMLEHLQRIAEVSKSDSTRTIYLDMDGPLADYDAGAKAHGLDPAKAKDTPGFFRGLPEKPGAQAAVADLLHRQIRVVVLSAPPESRPDEAVAEKRAWLKEHFPALEPGAQFTRDKGEVGEPGDILVDDHPEWANAMQFPGRVVRFRSAKDWECVHDLAIQETGALDAFIEAHGLKADGVVAKSEHDLGDPPHHSPTDPQKHAGNYKMAHWKLHGMDVTIENLAGSTRSGVNEAGEPWEVVLPYHYGYIKKTTGADGDHLDVAIGPLMDHCDEAHIINQNNPFTGEFDEHKVFIGFPTREAAISAFRQGRSDDPDKVLAGVVTVPIAELKRWIAEGCLEDEAILKAEHTAHVKEHYRVVNGRVTYIPAYDRQVHGEAAPAELHERTVQGMNRNAEHYIRATDSEDRDEILAVARQEGITPRTHRQSGANHHGRQGAYPHIYFGTQAEADAVMSEVRRRGLNTPESRATAAQENADTIQQARQWTDTANAHERMAQWSEAASAWRTASTYWGRRAASSTVSADLRQQAASHARLCNNNAISAQTQADQIHAAARAAAVITPQPVPAEPAHVITPAQVYAAASEEQNRYFSQHRAGELDRRVWLENVNAETNTSKFYAIDLRKVGDGKWVVNIAYGRRGALHPTVRTETDRPVSQAEAMQIIDRIKRTKISGGYEVSDDSATPRLRSFAPLDNFQHPSVTPAAQQAVEATSAVAAAQVQPRPAAPARPRATVPPPPAAAPAPATPPATATSTYNVMRQSAYDLGNVARNTESETTPTAFMNSLKAAQAHEAAIPVARLAQVASSSSNGEQWHKDRAAHWMSKAKFQWTSAVNNAIATPTSPFKQAVENGTGYAAAARHLEAVKDILGKRPAGATRPPGMSEADLQHLSQNIPTQIRGLATGEAIQAVPHQETLRARIALTGSIIHSAMGGGAVTEAEKPHAQKIFQSMDHLSTMLRTAETAAADPKAEPETLKAHAELLHLAAAQAKRTITTGVGPDATKVIWAKAPAKLVDEVSAHADKLVVEANRRAARPRVADPRFLAIHESSQRRAADAHAAAEAGHDRAKMIAAVHAHKEAAVSAYHHALAQEGPERAAWMAKSHEHAEHARNYIDKLNRR